MKNQLALGLLDGTEMRAREGGRSKPLVTGKTTNASISIMRMEAAQHLAQGHWLFTSL